MTYTYNSYSSRSSSYLPEIKGKEKDQPLDTVSCIVWDVYKSEPMFAASSWDGFVRIYMINQQDLNKVWEIFLHHPVLCIDFGDNGVIYAGLASGDVVAVQLQSSSIVHLGAHDAPICGIFWIREKGCLMTLGFDNLIRFWTLQASNALQMQWQLPLKTVTCSFDFPYLLIGSVETTVCIINLKGLPNSVSIPNHADQYNRTTLQRFSKFVSSRVISQNNSAIMGTIDGRALGFNFKQNYNGKIEITVPFVTRVQKRTDSKGSGLYGQINSVDLGYHNYQSFAMIAGTEEAAVFNLTKKLKSKSLASSSTMTGAGTAVRISPKNEYIAYATGSDWTKGLYQLESIKKPKIGVVKLSNSDLNDYVSR